MCGEWEYVVSVCGESNVVSMCVVSVCGECVCGLS